MAATLAFPPADALGARDNKFGREFFATYFRAHQDTLVDGCVVSFDDASHPTAVSISATAPEHLDRGLDEIEEELLSSGFACERELADPGAFTVTTSGGKVGSLGPLFGQAVRVLSRFSEAAPFALADLVVGSSAKLLVGPHAARGLAKPPSQCRGFIAIPPAGGAVEARMKLRVPAYGQPILDLGIGIADQPNPRYGVNLATWASSARFCLEVSAGDAVLNILDEDVYPELYPSGEVPEYDSLVARGFRAGFMRRQLLDLTRWRGKEVELRFRTEVPPEFDALYTIPAWSVPRLLLRNDV